MHSSISKCGWCSVDCNKRGKKDTVVIIWMLKARNWLQKCHILTFISRKSIGVKDIKITCKNRPVVKPCCSGLPNGLPPLIASRILSLKLQSMMVWILLCCMEKRVDIEPTPKWNTDTYLLEYLLHSGILSQSFKVRTAQETVET
jgi:hypothetical protein